MIYQEHFKCAPLSWRSISISDKRAIHQLVSDQGRMSLATGTGPINRGEQVNRDAICGERRAAAQLASLGAYAMTRYILTICSKACQLGSI